MAGQGVMTVPSKGTQEFRGTPTTRMYPRTMTDAFNDPVERAQWWYPPKKSTTWLDVATGLLGVVLWIGLAYLMVGN